jgi:hypothetical protein
LEEGKHLQHFISTSSTDMIFSNFEKSIPCTFARLIFSLTLYIMENKIILQISDKPNKKLVANVNGKKVYFGAVKPDGIPYSDYTEHKSPIRKEHYIARHEKREKHLWGIDGITTPSWWARWVLWNKPSLKQSIDDINQRFHLNIVFKKSA